jgi:hypothetical protein
MTSKMIDGVEIRTYSVRKDYTEKRERKIALALLLTMMTFAVFTAIGELNGAPDVFINDTASFISTHN